MKIVNIQSKNVAQGETPAKRSYKKPEVKKYPLVQQTTGYVIYYYAS